MSKWDLVNELHRGARKNFERRTTNMRGIKDTIQADLVEMIPYAAYNKKMKYILTVINIFSKKAYARPLKTKNGVDVTKAMKSILNEVNHTITNLHVDRGKEFYKQSMKEMLHRRNFHLHSTFSTKKAAIVERFNRTLKNKMWKQFSFLGSYKWIDILPELLNEYNNTKHSTIKMCPNQVNATNEFYLMTTVYNHQRSLALKSEPKFRLGDFVRISKYKHIFDKGYTPNWTTEIFKIKNVYHTIPITYGLIDLDGHDIQGCVYANELQIVEDPKLYLIEKILRRRGDEVFVKWLGFNSSYNSWINVKKLL